MESFLRLSRGTSCRPKIWGSVVARVTKLLVGGVLLLTSTLQGSSAVLRTPWSPSAKGDVYIDCRAGSDDALGATPGTALRTLNRISWRDLAPGTKVHLRRSCAWSGKFGIAGLGTRLAPIVVTAYGVGDTPRLTRLPDGTEHPVLDVVGSFVTVQNIRIDDAPAAAISLRGPHATVRDVSIRNTGTGIRIAAPDALVTRVTVADLHMIVDTPGGDDDYGAVGFSIEADRAEIAYSRCTNCRAPSHDFTFDGGFVEIYNHGDDAFIHNNLARNTEGLLEVGGDLGYLGGARRVRLVSNTACEVHGGIWTHGGDLFTIPAPGIRLEGTMLVNRERSSTPVVGGDTASLVLRDNVFVTPDKFLDGIAPQARSGNSYYATSRAELGLTLLGSEHFHFFADWPSGALPSSLSLCG